ncbi:MAG: IS256 family transposase [Candidatus Limnocylindria bacterium]
MLRVVQDGAERAEFAEVLDEIVRDGARRMLAAALESEVDAYVSTARTERDDRGHALVTRNGKARTRTVVTGAGALEVRAPRVNDRRTNQQGERIRFASDILPPYARKSPKVSQVLPLLYLHGLSTGDFRPALSEFFGSDAGLSPAAITRLTSAWEAERKEFMARKLKVRDYVYIWVDGVHFNVRLGDDGRLCCLVMVGVRLDGTKELIALTDGYRESTESWAELLRGCKKRGMRAPVVAVGDGALGFWAAVKDVFPETRPQRDWVHKTANVLDRLPKSVQPAAKRAIFEITNAENKEAAQRAVVAFADEFGAKWPKAVTKIVDDQDALLTFYDFPAEHWKHLRTTNPIESTFAPVRARTNLTKGPGSREAGLAMVFKLIEAAEGRWRKINGHELVALVRAGAKFVNGKLVEAQDDEKDAA